MSCSRTVALECALPADVYWRLKSDPGWDAYCDALDGNARTVLSSKEDNGFMTVHASVRAKENPIPKALRRTLGVGPTFSFEITETWHRDRHDASHPATFETKPAVLPSKIRVGGKHWVVPDGPNKCVLHFRLDASVSVLGIGSKLAKGIASSAIDSYLSIPGRAVEYRHSQTETATAAPPVTLVSAQGLGGTNRALAQAAVQIATVEDPLVAARISGDAEILQAVEAWLPPEGVKILRDSLSRFMAHLTKAEAAKSTASATALHARQALAAFGELLLQQTSASAQMPSRLPCCGARSKQLISEGPHVSFHNGVDVHRRPNEPAVQASASKLAHQGEPPLEVQLTRAQQELAQLRQLAEEMILSAEPLPVATGPAAARQAELQPARVRPRGRDHAAARQAERQPARVRPRGRDRSDELPQHEEYQKEPFNYPPGWRGDRFVI